MIVIDSRAGSAELAPLFPPEVDVSVSRLDYGDMFFVGNGPEHSLVSIGIERKAIKDFLNSMVTGRLSGHQLPGMNQQYDYRYIVVEGNWRFNPATGILETLNGTFWADASLGPRRFMAKEVIAFINTLVVKAGVHVMYSRGKKETVQIVASLYHWWNDKQWDQHTSHLSPSKVHKGNHGEIQLIKPSLVRRIASELPLIGWGKSAAVADHFSSVVQMANARVQDWMKIPGVGKGIAEKVVEEITKENF